MLLLKNDKYGKPSQTKLANSTIKPLQITKIMPNRQRLISKITIPIRLAAINWRLSDVQYKPAADS